MSRLRAHEMDLIFGHPLILGDGAEVSGRDGWAGDVSCPVVQSPVVFVDFDGVGDRDDVAVDAAQMSQESFTSLAFWLVVKFSTGFASQDTGQGVQAISVAGGISSLPYRPLSALREPIEPMLSPPRLVINQHSLGIETRLVIRLHPLLLLAQRRAELDSPIHRRRNRQHNPRALKHLPLGRREHTLVARCLVDPLHLLREPDRPRLESLGHGPGERLGAVAEAQAAVGSGDGGEEAAVGLAAEQKVQGADVRGGQAEHGGGPGLGELADGGRGALRGEELEDRHGAVVGEHDGRVVEVDALGEAFEVLADADVGALVILAELQVDIRQ